MRAILVISAMSAVLLAGRASTQSVAPDPQALDLARQIVAFDGDRERMSKQLDALGQLLPSQVGLMLSVQDPAQKQKIADLVKARLETMKDGLVAARVSAMAQTYPADLLQGGLAFRHTPTGEAYRNATPALNAAAGAALLSDKPTPVDPAIPQAKLALIDRILKAQDVEGSSRKGWRALSAMLNQAGGGAPSTPSAQDAADETAYVQSVMAAEIQFYAQTFSDAQLADLVAYFEGPVGHAFQSGAARLLATGAPSYADVMAHTYDHFSDEMCAAVTCTPAQRTQLNDAMAKIQSIIASVSKLAAG